MRILIAVAALLLTAQNLLANDFGTSVGQQNNVSVGVSSAASGRWVSVPYTYRNCGRCYTSYKQVWQPAAQADYQAKGAQQITPVGSINTDNSSTYNYSYTINYSQLPLAQGGTHYGQPYSEVADIYGNIDFGVYYDQAIRAMADAGKLHSSAMQGTLSLLDKAGENQTRVAETLARGQADAQRISALAELAKASAVGNSVHITRQHSSNFGDGQTRVESKVETSQLSGDLGPLQVVFNQNCVKCHGGVKQDGGLDLRDVSKLSSDVGDKILDRITTLDESKRMPRDNENKPATLDRDAFKTIYKYVQ